MTKNLLTLCSATVLCGGVLVGTQAMAQSSVSFATEGDVTEVRSLGGHTCGSQDLLERVTLNFQASAVDSEIPGTDIRGLGIENTDPVSGGEIESCNQLVTLSLTAVGGPGAASLSVPGETNCLTRTLDAFDGTADFAGTSGASMPGATDIDATSTVTISDPGGLAFFTASGFDVQFVFDARGTGSNETADAEFANGLDGSGSVSVSYSCGAPPTCPIPGGEDLPADSPLCVRCQFNPDILAGNEACVPPQPVPGITTSGLLISLLGLPLIAGFFASRRRNRK